MDDHDRDDEDTDRRRPTAAELRRHKRTVPGGIPVLPEPGPTAAEPSFEWPFPDHVDAEVLRRAGRDPSEPAAPAEISAIVRRLEERLLTAFRTLTPQDVDKRLDATECRLGALEHDIDPVRRLGKWAAGMALGAALAIGAFLYRRGADEQRVADDIKAVREKAERCETKIDSHLNLKEPRP